MLLVLLAAPGVRAQDDADPFAIPESITIRQGEVYKLRLSPAASLILNGSPLVEAVRTREGVELRGRFLGTITAFVSDAERTDALTIRVEPARPVESGVRRSDPAFAMEDPQLHFSTGGWITSSALSATTAGATDSGFNSSTLVGLITGERPELSYTLSGLVTRSNGKLQQENVQGQWRTPWGHGGLFPGVSELTEFAPLPTGLATRDAFFDVDTTGGLGVHLGARAPYQFDRFDFNPEAARGYASQQFGPGTFGVGAIAGGLGSGKPTWLPFASAGIASQAARASVFGGMVPGSGARIAGAQAQVGLGRCDLQASYTTGLHGDDTANAREALLDYVDPGVNAFTARGRCRAGALYLQAGALRGGRTTAFIDSRHTLLSGAALWSHGTLELQAFGSWNVSGGDDARNFAAFNARKRLGEFEVSAAENATYLLQQWTLTETAMLRRQAGPTSLGLSGGTSHGLSRPNSFFTTADTRIESPQYYATAALQATVAPDSPVSWNGNASLAWRPFPAYTLQASTSLDLRLYRHWNLALTFGYQFGDSLPREPLLAGFRNDSVEARAFEDYDGDGKWGKDEPPLEGVRVCIDKDTCGLTGPSGSWVASGIGEGVKHARANPIGIEGAVPTTDVDVPVPIGTYSRPSLSFGFRRTGEIILAAFDDSNGNGKRDADEPLFMRGAAQVTGPRLDAAVPFNLRGKAIFTQTGNYRVTVDLLALPSGYAAPRDLVVHADGFRPITVEVPIRPIRSIAGRVCVDSNGDGRCDSAELGVARAHITVDGHQVLTDDDGNYFLPDLPAGQFDIKIPGADLPPGTALRKQSVALGERPAMMRGFVIPLQVDPRAHQTAAANVAGHEVFELGGFTFPAESLASGRLQPGEEQVLQRLASLGRKSTVITVKVSCEPVQYVAWPDKARAAAKAKAEVVAAWFRKKLRGGPQVLIEAATPNGRVERVEVRVYGPAPADSGKAPAVHPER